MMDGRVTLELLQAARAYRARAARLLGRVGLYPGQDALLKLLDSDGPMTMGEAASALSIQPPTVTKMVNRLAFSGLVETEVMNQDRRKTTVRLTEAARGKIKEIDSIWDILEREALNTLDAAALRIQLSTLTRNLGGANARNTPPG